MAMYDLQRGGEKKKRVDLLLKLTKIESESMIKAIYRVLVHGERVNSAAFMESVDESSLRKALERLNSINAVVEQIKEHDLYGKT